MRYNLRTIVVAAAIAGCGGNDASSIDPQTDDFVVDTATQEQIDNAAKSGDGAEGSYVFDETTGALTITITSSSFACNIEVGTLRAIVVEVDATTLVLEFDDGGGATWTRIDMGVENPANPVVGIWMTSDPELYLVLANDMTAQLFGQGDECYDDRPRNQNNCLRLEPSSAAIVIDGDLSDWGAVPAASKLEDPAGDFAGSDPGADLAELAAVYDGTHLHWLMGLHAAPSQSFQGGQEPNGGAYRVTIQGYNGLSDGATVTYSPIEESWVQVGITSDIQMAVGATGIEFSLDISAFVGEGFESVDLILLEAIDNSGIGGNLDDMYCGYLPISP